jgi:hypothetical protein
MAPIECEVATAAVRPDPLWPPLVRDEGHARIPVPGNGPRLGDRTPAPGVTARDWDWESPKRSPYYLYHAHLCFLALVLLWQISQVQVLGEANNPMCKVILVWFHISDLAPETCYSPIMFHSLEL